jgi:hypothetical protein
MLRTARDDAQVEHGVGDARRVGARTEVAAQN